MKTMKSMLASLVFEEDGAAASEYAILVAAIVVAVFAAVKLFDIGGIFTAVNSKVNNCVSGASC